MNDLISRQEAIEAVEKLYYEDLEAYGCEIPEMFHCDRAIEALNALPSAQPEIIHCKECMHNGSFDTDCPIDWAGKNYCSFAERRTDG